MTGVNNVAACLVARKLRAFSPDAKIAIQGGDMDHRVFFEVAGIAGCVESYPGWLYYKMEIVKRLGW